MSIDIGNVYELQGDFFSREYVREGIAARRDKLYELLLRKCDEEPDNTVLLLSIKQSIDYLNDIAPYIKY